MEFKVTNNLTGEVIHERTADRRGVLRERGRELYYADTKTKWLDEDDGEDGGEAPTSTPTLKINSAAAKTVAKMSKKPLTNEDEGEGRLKLGGIGFCICRIFLRLWSIKSSCSYPQKIAN